MGGWVGGWVGGVGDCLCVCVASLANSLLLQGKPGKFKPPPDRKAIPVRSVLVEAASGPVKKGVSHNLSLHFIPPFDDPRIKYG